MSTAVDYEMTRERDLLTSLWLSDEETQGRPRLPADTEERTRDYLSLLLVEDRAENAHIDLLEEFYRAKFRCSLSRCFWQGGPRPPLEVAAGFRHNQLLAEETVRAVAERGPSVLSSDELAVLLLNPYALSDLADLIGFSMPEFWLDRLAQVGQEMIDRYHLDIPIPGIEEMPSSRK